MLRCLKTLWGNSIHFSDLPTQGDEGFWVWGSTATDILSSRQWTKCSNFNLSFPFSRTRCVGSGAAFRRKARPGMGRAISGKPRSSLQASLTLNSSLVATITVCDEFPNGSKVLAWCWVCLRLEMSKLNYQLLTFFPLLLFSGGKPGARSRGGGEPTWGDVDKRWVKERLFWFGRRCHILPLA